MKPFTPGSWVKCIDTVPHPACAYPDGMPLPETPYQVITATHYNLKILGPMPFRDGHEVTWIAKRFVSCPPPAIDVGNLSPPPISPNTIETTNNNTTMNPNSYSAVPVAKR